MIVLSRHSPDLTRTLLSMANQSHVSTSIEVLETTFYNYHWHNSIEEMCRKEQLINFSGVKLVDLNYATAV